jgi:hypothetical protein
MKITHDTADRLVIEDRPWAIGLGFAAAILIFAAIGLARLFAGAEGAGVLLFGAALGGVGFCVFVRRTIAIFDRPAGALVWREASVFGAQERTVPLREIAGVEVEAGRGVRSSRRGRRTPTWRPVLRLKGDAAPLPLNRTFVSGDGAARVADAVTAWLGRA